MMKIGIDARMFGSRHTGVGRYVENLIKGLVEEESIEITFFVNHAEVASLTPLLQNGKHKICEVNIPHYSLAEQILLPFYLLGKGLEVIHFPHFNVPIFYFGRYVVTIHDLIKHSFKGQETTTKTPWFYWLKYLGYKLIFSSAVRRSSKILVPSQAVKSELVKKYKLNEDKVAVTHEGVDETFQSVSQSSVEINSMMAKYKFKKPFVVYTGNVYPHKNIPRLLEAMKIINQEKDQGISLVLVCARGVFTKRLTKKIEEVGLEKDVQMIGFVKDEELILLYREAEAIVCPTLSEGFWLPGLEAISCGLPVVCSKIPVLEEIYEDAALYFDPMDPKDIAEKILTLVGDQMLKEKLLKRGREQVKKYSWAKMARETLEIYEQSLNT